MDLYEAVYYRRWVKNFEMVELSPVILKNIENYCNHVNLILLEERLSFRIETKENLWSKYSQIIPVKSLLKAPYYFVVSVDDLEDQLMEAGYLIGQLALYLTMKGIGCTVVNIEKQKQRQNGKEQWMIVFAFGLTKEGINTNTKKLKSFVSDKHCVFKITPDANMRKILLAAGVYPTSMLYQPYRFVVNDRRIHIFMKKEAILTKHQRMFVKFEIGLMLTSMEIKAEELWMNATFKKLYQNQDYDNKKYEYCMSCYII